MRPEFLLPETTVRDAGTSPAIDLREERGGRLFVTLGINRIVERESIEIGVWGSTDGTDWGNAPLLSYPQKFYCGTYQILLDLSETSQVKHLRSKWQVNRWGKGDPKPLFSIYLFVQAMQARLAAAG